MKKVVVTKMFTLGKFNLLKNIVRKNEDNNIDGSLYVGDVFECDDEMFNYLTGNNPENKKVVELIEYKDAKVVDADKVEVKVIVDEKKVEEKVINTKKSKKRNNKKNK